MNRVWGENGGDFWPEQLDTSWAGEGGRWRRTGGALGVERETGSGRRGGSWVYGRVWCGGRGLDGDVHWGFISIWLVFKAWRLRGDDHGSKSLGCWSARAAPCPLLPTNSSLNGWTLAFLTAHPICFSCHRPKLSWNSLRGSQKRPWGVLLRSRLPEEGGNLQPWDWLLLGRWLSGKGDPGLQAPWALREPCAGLGVRGAAPSISELLSDFARSWAPI